MHSRRKFIQQTSLIGTGVALSPSITYGIFNTNQNNKLNVVLIGVGLRGTNHLENLLLRNDVNITPICDTDSNRIEIAKKLIDNAKAKPPKVFGRNDYDYRNLLELKDVDAVLIATPWLWHTRGS